MPTYQYRCTACADEFEVVQKFTDAALTDCPACSGGLRKVFSAVGVVFKGSGFYATDNRIKGSASAAKPAAAEASPGSAGTRDSATTAPAAPAASPAA